MNDDPSPVSRLQMKTKCSVGEMGEKIQRGHHVVKSLLMRNIMIIRVDINDFSIKHVSVYVFECLKFPIV